MTHHENSFRIATTVLALALINCTDQKMTSQSNLSADDIGVTSNGLNKNVGRPIDQSIAQRWMGNFKKKNTRETTTAYLIDGTSLMEIMADRSCIGISLCYATDDQGALHVLPIGVDNNGKMMTASTVSTENGKIEWAKAMRWIDQYAGSIKSHFFGTATYTKLLVDLHSTQVRASLAVNDTGAPQLLLSNASDLSPTSYVDESQPCPPYCSR